MKAIVCKAYGAPERLGMEDLPKPMPKSHEVLVRVHAAAVNDFDWSLVRGKPFLYRLIFGLRKPKTPVPGIELAGVVEMTGSGVTRFKSGDAVYGDISDRGWGTFAEYACVPEDAVHMMSAKMTFAEAASLPHASMLAWQGLVEVGKIQQGESVLINGGGGGMGTLGVQIAKLYYAEVTGVDAGNKLNTMKSLGFDHVIDYTKTDFTRTGQRYDLILDAKTKKPPSAYQRALKPGGRYVTVGGDPARLVQVLIAGKFGKKNKHVVALKPNKTLATINELFDAGKIRCVIDGPHPIADAAKLIRYFGEGKHQGKVVMSF